MACARHERRRFGRRAGAIAGALVLLAAGATAPAGADAPREPQAAAAALGELTGLAFDAAGRLHAADRGQGRIVTLGFGGEVLGVLGDGRLDAPAGVAVAPDGDVLVADADGVQRLRPGGSSAAGFAARAPAGIAVAADGTIFVSEPGRVARFSPAGVRLGDWAADDPRGLAVAGDGSVWVAVDDALAHVSATGVPLGDARADQPAGVAIAPDGTVLVAERGRDRVARLTAAGERIGEIEGFDHPRAVAVDCRGSIAVADDSPARVHRIAAAGAPPPCGLATAAAVAAPVAAPLTAPVAPAAEPARPIARRPPAISQAAAPQPALGVDALAGPVTGTVLARRPGERGATVLTAGARVPIGTRLDARGGRVRLTFATATADFDRLGTTQTADLDSGVFSIHQERGRSAVELRLQGAPPRCGRPAYARPVGPRHLWADVSGRFTTRGRQASATATTAGARWLTEDRCDGTLIRVAGGATDVRDRLRRRSVGVRAGGRYLARPARRGGQAAARSAA
ncbi:MAG: tripartite motif-containing protein 71 [Solirubrobacteraceae bacterium]|jgi:DNA-binding beta-propeller fold protein YncE|nr:tripartite motif-containing protein 71 [Solirubrobacteraceae bacterium]